VTLYLVGVDVSVIVDVVSSYPTPVILATNINIVPEPDNVTLPVNFVPTVGLIL
jgi:hypothetical protein